MRVLLDECLNWRLGRALTGHFCTSVQRMGWSGIRNGELLEKMRQERSGVRFVKECQDIVLFFGGVLTYAATAAFALACASGMAGPRIR